jgi:thiamine pyrophosphokinase
MVRALLIGPRKIKKELFSQLIKRLKLRSSDLIIGVDGGVKRARDQGVILNFAIGDWDSLRNAKNNLINVKHVTVSQAKDRSDLFYAVLAAIELGAEELVCVGVTGGRPDHHLAMLSDLASFASGNYGRLRSVSALGDEGEYHFLSERISHWSSTQELIKKSDFTNCRVVSLIPVACQYARGVSTEGLQYELKDATLRPSSHGLSNLTIKRKFQVSLRKGQLLVIIPR